MRLEIAVGVEVLGDRKVRGPGLGAGAALEHQHPEAAIGAGYSAVTMPTGPEPMTRTSAANS